MPTRLTRQLLALPLTFTAALALLALPLIVRAEAPASCIWDAEYKPSFSDILNRVACNAGLVENYGGQEEVTEATFVGIIGAAISVVLGFTGVIFAIIILYGGYLWMTARGNDEQVTQAIHYIRNSVIGVIVVFSAFAITRFAVTNLTGIVSQQSP